MGRVIRFRGGRHREVQDLLPWFLADRLDADEQALVETHLSVCADCQAEVRFQRRLGSEIAQMPLDVEQSWSLMRQRIEQETQQRPAARPAARPRASGVRWSPPAWLSGGAMAGAPLAGVWAWRNSIPLGGAAMAGALLTVGALWITGPLGQADSYHALSAGPPVSSGNLMVIFKPDTPEHSLREAMRASHARLVGGPTEADAYVLSVAAGERDAALASLRARADIVVAQPIDPGGDR
jgi:hypothetical protein